MTMRKIIIIAIILLGLSSVTLAKLDLYGTYYQNLMVVKMHDWYYQDVNLFYLKFRRPYEGDYKLEGNFSFSLLAHGNERDSIGFNIEDLNFQTSFKRFELKIGRFLPRYNYTNFFQPLDIFLGAQIFQNDLVFTGIDGISLKRFFGMLSSAQYIALPTTYLAQSSHYLNFTSNIGAFDFSLMSYYDGETYRKQTGVGFKGDLLVSLFNETVAEYTELDEMSIQSATGLDYSYKEFMFMLEYLYSESDLDLANVETIGLRDTNYLYANLFYFEMMGKTAGVSALTNLDDMSSLLSAYYQDQIFNGVTFLVGAYVPTTDEYDKEFNTENLGDVIFNCYLKAKF